MMTATEHRPFQIAELVEQKQRMVAGAFEVPVVSRPLLVAIGLADRTVHVEDQLLERHPLTNLVDPPAGKIHE